MSNTIDNKSNKNNIIKRLLAIITIVILLLLYISTLVLAILGHGLDSNLFMGCILATISLPIFSHIIIFLYSRYTGRKAPGDPE